MLPRTARHVGRELWNSRKRLGTSVAVSVPRFSSSKSDAGERATTLASTSMRRGLAAARTFVIARVTPEEEARVLSQLNDIAGAVERFSVTIPFTKQKIGIGKVAGKVPAAGAIAHAAIGSFIILAAARQQAPKLLLARMTASLIMGTAISAVPVVGGALASGYKTNAANLRLLEEHMGSKQRHEEAVVEATSTAQRSGKGGSWLQLRTLLLIMAAPLAAGLGAVGLFWYYVLHKLGLL